MSTLAQLASYVVANYDSLSSTDQEYNSRVTQVTAFGGEVLDDVAQYAEWDFLFKKANLTFMAGQNYIALPSDFLSMPSQGKIIRPDGAIMEPASMDDVIKLRQDSFSEAPTIYSITYQIEMTTVPTASAGTGSIYYQMGPTETTQLPTVFHRGVVLQGMIARALEVQGNALSSVYYQRYRTGLADMQRRLRSGKNRPFRFGMTNPTMY